jgi:hypothetical protein
MITPFVPFPTRAVCSGEITLAATTARGFGGSSSRQVRVMFVVQNTDATNAIQLLDGTGKLFANIAAGAPPFALASSMPFQVYNPNGVNVKFTVLELFPDIEGSSGEFTRQITSAGHSMMDPSAPIFSSTGIHRNLGI